VLSMIVCLSLNWKTVEESQTCVVYDSITREYSSEPLDKPGSYSVGPSAELLCYPKTIQKLDIYLTCRTVEGLNLNAQIDIDYRLRPAEISSLFEKVTTGYHTLYQRVARSSLRNTASRFKAMTYLTATDEGNRENISLTMRTDLDNAIKPYHADILRVHMRSVDLPAAFEQAFADVEQLKLERRQVAANLNINMQKAKMDNRTKVIQMKTEFDKQIVAAEIAVKKVQQSRNGAKMAATQQGKKAMIEAHASRDRQLIEAAGKIKAAEAATESAKTKAEIEGQTSVREAVSSRASQIAAAEVKVETAIIAREGERLKAKIRFATEVDEAQTQRTKTLSTAQVEVRKAVAARAALLEEKRTELAKLRIQVQRQLLEATTETQSKELEAHAKRLAQEEATKAEVNGINLMKSAEKELLVGLKGAGMNNTEILRYLYMKSLGKLKSKSKVFLDLPDLAKAARDLRSLNIVHGDL